MIQGEVGTPVPFAEAIEWIKAGGWMPVLRLHSRELAREDAKPERLREAVRRYAAKKGKAWEAERKYARGAKGGSDPRLLQLRRAERLAARLLRARDPAQLDREQRRRRPSSYAGRPLRAAPPPAAP